MQSNPGKSKDPDIPISRGAQKFELSCQVESQKGLETIFVWKYLKATLSLYNK